MNRHQTLARHRYSGAELSLAVTPECGPNDVMVAPRFVGLCGTDIQVWRRGRDATANILGHEGVGIVTEVGQNVSTWSRGETVVFNPVNPANPSDVLGLSYDGLFQERILIENAESFKWLMTGISSVLLKPLGALIQPVASAIRAKNLAGNPVNTRNAVIVGDGPMALITSIVLRLAGFQSVMMVRGASTRSQWGVQNGYFGRRDVISDGADVPGEISRRLNGMPLNLWLFVLPARQLNG